MRQRPGSAKGVIFMTLEDVSLVNISFGPEYTAAVERKQIAQQEAERAKYKVEQAKQEKRAVIVKAQGEAEAARKISEAMEGNPGFLELRRIEKAREIAHAIAKSPNRVYLDTDILMFSLGSEAMAKMDGESKALQQTRKR